MDYLLVFISGVLLGATIVVVINWILSSQTKDIAKQLVYTVESQRVEDMENILGRVRGSNQKVWAERGRHFLPARLAGFVNQILLIDAIAPCGQLVGLLTRHFSDWLIQANFLSSATKTNVRFLAEVTRN